MCRVVYFRGQACQSQGDLKKAVGLAVLPMREGYTPDGIDADDVCLCPVDVREVARRIGVYCEDDGTCWEFQEIDRS
jgi:hypothetical protein